MKLKLNITVYVILRPLKDIIEVFSRFKKKNFHLFFFFEMKKKSVGNVDITNHLSKKMHLTDSVRVIVHRGYKNYPENSILSIMTVLLKKPESLKKNVLSHFAECDLVFFQGVWVLSHSYLECVAQKRPPETLESLCVYLVQHSSSLDPSWALLFDIKWEELFQHHETMSRQEAFQSLFNIFRDMYTGLETQGQFTRDEIKNRIWCQFPRLSFFDPSVSDDLFSEQAFMYINTRGLLVQDLDMIPHTIPDTISFLMLPLVHLTPDILDDLRHRHRRDLFLVGYTCPNAYVLQKCSHILKHLNGLVCDIQIS